MSTDKSKRKKYLYPVEPEYMDYYVPRKWHDTTYISFIEDEDTLSWFSCSIADKIFIEVNDDPEYFKQFNKVAVPITWKALLSEFRALNYNEKLMYVYGCNNHVPDNIFGASGNHLYPNETLLASVLIDPKQYALNELHCKTVDIDGQTCVYFGSSPNELVNAFSPKDRFTMFSALPLGILADKYRYGIFDETIYDILLAVTSSKAALETLTDDMKKELFGE
jgi:hypothetical protein